MAEKNLLCMNCGHPQVFYLHCKIRCANCGFLLDCSDLDVGGEIQRAALAAARQHWNFQAPRDSDDPVPNNK
jgi:hypothetical protein